MKTLIKFKNMAWALSALMVFGLASCKKDHANIVGGTGAPTITSVHTLSKVSTIPDTIVVTTYDNAGNVTTTKEPTSAPLVAFDSTTVSGNKGQTYVIHGTNLGSTTSVLFNGVSAYFNPALLSDNTILVAIPSNVPTANQSNKLTVVTLHGKAVFNFTINTPPPTITTVSDYDFTSGYQIKLTGVSFSTVTTVGLTGSTATATIVAQTDTTMTLQMPTATVNRANLVFTYASGKATSTQEFIDLDNAYQIFANNAYQNSWSDNSWSHPSGVSNAASHSGTASILASYPAGAWQVEGWANFYPSIDYNPDYKYLTFWVKGGKATHTLVLVGDQMKGGYGQVQNANAYAAQLITVPAGVWTYFKIPLGAPSSSNPALLNFWANGTPAKQLGFFLQGGLGATADVDEAIYFDEVAFVK